ncbi:hypothetical protein JM93_01571 [Roseibium hamelinense]|uniref:Uncharacterized protein n=1 Tax=Roseibium hamelinense TaxID=150831 RepID=A0A562T860_9HYPH|nr:hypothetical protein [Roseibium hamelinense]MTI43688.1 hypothetical protein [Roseibium hamelinense]TWI89368.1 hypothetical protein JM93_01571 [Roseibium hamelinense]
MDTEKSSDGTSFLKPKAPGRFSGKCLADAVKAERAEVKARKRDEGRLKAAAKAEAGRPPPAPVRGGEECPPSRVQMVSRLYRAFSGQMDQMEARLKSLALDQAELGDIDKTVKALASLARTLAMLMELDREAADKEADQSDDDDAEALRRDLAQRLVRLRGQGPA